MQGSRGVRLAAQRYGGTGSSARRYDQEAAGFFAELGDPADDLILMPDMRVRRPWRFGLALAAALAFLFVWTYPTGLILLNWLSGGYR